MVSVMITGDILCLAGLLCRREWLSDNSLSVTPNYDLSYRSLSISQLIRPQYFTCVNVYYLYCH